MLRLGCLCPTCVSCVFWIMFPWIFMCFQLQSVMWRITQICLCIQDLKSCWCIPAHWPHLKSTAQTKERKADRTWTFSTSCCLNSYILYQSFPSNLSTESQPQCENKERTGLLYWSWAAKGSVIRCEWVTVCPLRPQQVDVWLLVPAHLTLCIAVHLCSSLLASKVPLSLP